MLLVRTRLRMSKIHGIGCFVRDDVPKGKPVWMFHVAFDRLISPQDAEACHDRDFVDTYTQVCAATGMLLLCADNARFINHSERPNISSNVPLSDPDCIDVALRDILAGEELTQDYRPGDARLWSGFAMPG